MLPFIRIRTMAGTRAGLTLVELLVVAAISSVLMLAAVSLLVSMQQTRTRSRQQLERIDQTFSAAVQLERPLLNAGYNFPSSRYAVRFYNNVAGPTLVGQFVGGTCPTCIVPDTDVVEVVEGIGQPFARVIGPANRSGSPPLSARLEPPGFRVQAADVNTRQFLFLFTDDQGRNCLGRGLVRNGGPCPTCELFFTDVDRETLTDQAANYFGSTAPRDYQCPAAGMAATAAGIRRRYFVNQDAAGNFSLRLLELNPVTLDGATGALSVVSQGIDNLQAIPLVERGPAAFTAGCQNNLCECNIRGADCVMNNQFDLTERITGMKLRLSARVTSVSQNLGVDTTSVLADETPRVDRIPRQVQEQAYSFRNFAQVQP
jgi:prepilin-type N-terminal cleavage/methylation domain-containing protein